MKSVSTRTGQADLQIPGGVPARRHADGSLRVGDSRVHLWLVLGLLTKGTSPESVVADFPSLSLDDVRMIDAFRRENPGQVDAYCRAIEMQAKAMKQRITREQRARRAG